MTAPPAVDVERAYALDPAVAVRPEPFGALCYHYGNRRLTFLKSAQMVAVVRSLDAHPSVAGALSAAGVEASQWPAYARALATLEESGVVRPR